VAGCRITLETSITVQHAVTVSVAYRSCSSTTAVREAWCESTTTDWAEASVELQTMNSGNYCIRGLKNTFKHFRFQWNAGRIGEKFSLSQFPRKSNKIVRKSFCLMKLLQLISNLADNSTPFSKTTSSA